MGNCESSSFRVLLWDSTNSPPSLPPAFSFLSRWRPCNIRDTRSEIRSRLASLPLLLYRSLSKRRLTAMVHLPQFPRTARLLKGPTALHLNSLPTARVCRR